MAKARGLSGSSPVKKLGSRAVLRFVMPGDTVSCTHCGNRLKFEAKKRNRKIICNVYKRGKWNRVEHYHEACYDAANHPHGEVDTTIPRLGLQGSRGS